LPDLRPRQADEHQYIHGLERRPELLARRLIRLRPHRDEQLRASAYVIGYNGTKAYWDPQAAGEVANEIVNATNGGNDGGGNHCARTYAEGGTFWVIGHSMGPTVIDFILGTATRTTRTTT
jgi:hypothetical protein